MATTLANLTSSAHLLRSETPARMAKADLRKAEINPLHEALGGCMDEVRRVCGLGLEEFAHALGKNDRQIARQIKGEERPQIEAVFAVARFRAPLVIALSRITPDVEVCTEIRVRRSA